MKHKITWNSPVILGFALLSGVILAINTFTGGSLIRYFSIYKTSFTDPFMYVRLFTHVLGHADFSHYANNMMLFLVVGPMLEEKHGSRMIAEVILVTAFVTGFIHILFQPHTALLGASGVVFAFILMSSITGRGSGNEIPVTLIVVALIYISQQLWSGITAHDNISQLTHIIGGAVGAVYGLSLRR